MSNNSYVQMSRSDMKIGNLLSQINDILNQEQLDNITLTGELSFAPSGTANTGIIRFNGSNIQYSVDSGTTWKAVSDIDYAWKQNTTYNVGDTVLYSSAWWVCLVDNTTVTPGSNANWRLLSLGKEILFVSSFSQLVTALATTSNCTIYIVGNITVPDTYQEGSSVATLPVNGGVVTIYSDERTQLSSIRPVLFSLASAANVYWHCKRTVFINLLSSNFEVSAENGILWLESVFTNGYGLTFNSNVRYQEIINGPVTGGVQTYWTIPDTKSDLVPKNLSQLISGSIADSDLLYTYIDGTPCYLTLGDVSENIASLTAKYWHIDEQGLEENLPEYAPAGYLYYATDTGNLFRYNGEGWDSGVHIQGPAGSPGSSGQPGSDGVSPNIVLSGVPGGTMVTITDALHPSGQSFVVSNGAAGETPIINADVMTLPPNSSATVTVGGTPPNYMFTFGIPRGSDGAGGAWGEITGNLSDQQDLTSALSAKQNLIDIDNKLPYSLISGAPVIGSGLLSISSGGVEVAVFGANSEYNVALQLPVVNNATITFTQGGTPKGSITLNQSGDQTIALDAGGGGGTQIQADWNQADSTAVDYIKNKPTIPNVGSGTIIFTQGGVSKGEFNVNQSENQTIVLDAGGSGGSASPYTELIETSSAVLSAVVGNAYKWTLNNSSGTIAMAGTSSGYESFASLYIVLGGSATVTGNNVTLMDPLSTECLNLCGLQYDGGVARLYVYNVIPIITVTSSPITISGTAGTSLSSVDLKTYVIVGKSSVLNFVVDSNSVLPTGLTLSNDGVLTGTPTTGNNGSAVVNITTSKAEAKTMQLNFSISG